MAIAEIDGREIGGENIMPKSSLERELEKQRKESQKQAREAKRRADEAARRERAKAVIDGQPMVNGLRIMDANAEELLKIILDAYDGNDNNRVSGSIDNMPEYLLYSLSLELEKLLMYGVVSSAHNYIGGGWEVYLSNQGKSYFEEKKTTESVIDSKIDQGKHIDSKNVFIVHGHDELMKVSVANFVRKVGFNPIILHEQPDGGRTIIEKFHDYSDVAYAIILYSPDDEMKSGKKRARQNVVLEHGFFISRLGRERVVGLVKDPDEIEIPSDLNGVLYKPFNGTWEFAVAKEMNHCGLNVDMNKI